MAEFPKARQALAATGLRATYPVLLERGAPGEPLEAMALRAVCAALRGATGTSAERFSAARAKVESKDSSLELIAFLRAAENLPEASVSEYVTRSLLDFNFRQRCL